MRKINTPRKRKTKKNKTLKKKQIGSGFQDVLYKYIFTDKRKELIPQLKSIYKGFKDGYGLGGIGGWTDFAWDNGVGKTKLLTVPLSQIILWHPVRGPGERAEAGEKTTKRANSMLAVLNNNLKLGDSIASRSTIASITSEIKPESKIDLPLTITYSKNKPLTEEQLVTIPEMKSDDMIKICPVNISINIEKKDEIDALSKEIIDLTNTIEELKIIKKSRDGFRESAIESRIRINEQELNKKTKILQDLLYEEDIYEQYFLVLSGQGRLQAIIEAVRNANIPPNEFFIRVASKSIYLDICNVLLKIHNQWVKEGLFDDERHQVYIDGEYKPIEEINLAFSCSKDRSRLDTLCYSKYNTNNTRGENMGCSNVYNYEIPISRYFSK
jgi:hypothetical protein